MREAFKRGYKNGTIVERIRVRRGWGKAFRTSFWLFDREDAYHARSRRESTVHYLGHVVGNTVEFASGLFRSIRDAHKQQDHITVWIDHDSKK